MFRTSLPLLLVAALTIHCDKSGSGSDTPEPPDPLPDGLAAHPEVDGELPSLVSELESRTSVAEKGRPAKLLWLGSTMDWERKRHPGSGAIIGRYFKGMAILKIEGTDEDECALIQFKADQELLETGQFGLLALDGGLTFPGNLTCRSAGLADFGHKPGSVAPAAADGAAPAGETPAGDAPQAEAAPASAPSP